MLKDVADEIVSSIAQKAKDAGLSDEILASYPLGQTDPETSGGVLANNSGITVKWAAGNGHKTQTVEEKADDIGSKWKR